MTALVAVALLAAAGAGADRLFGDSPRAVTVAHELNVRTITTQESCRTQTDFGHDGDSRHPVHVDTDTTSVDLVWLSAANAPCQVARTSATATVAARLALAIDTAHALPTGRINCGADFGTAVILYFHQAGTSHLQRVDVFTSGCATVSAPDRARRSAGLVDLPASPLCGGHPSALCPE